MVGNRLLLELHVPSPAILKSGLIKQGYLAGQKVHISTDLKNVAAIEDFLSTSGFKDYKIYSIEPDIEDCFISLMVR